MQLRYYPDFMLKQFTLRDVVLKRWHIRKKQYIDDCILDKQIRVFQEIV